MASILVLTGCAGKDSGDSKSDAASTSVENTAEEISTELKNKDTNYEYDEESVTKINLAGDTATCDDDSVSIETNKVTITKEGDYLLSGEFTGSIVVNATKEEDVRLILKNADITGDTNAAIYCSQADKLIVTLDKDSKNSLSDAKDFVYTDTTNEEPDATLFSKADLSINGLGELQVTANYNNGIGTKDDLIITTGTISVTAANHAIRGRDSVTITDGTFTLNSGADGIQSNNDEDEAKGLISIEGGTFNITAGNDGIQAETNLSISGGEFEIKTASGHESTDIDTEESYKGIKANGNVFVSNGTFTIDSADDSIHSNGDIKLEGGEFTLSSGDDGVHADGDMIVEPVSIDIITCYEGLESKTMTIKGGDISIYATDDGINISGGSNDTGEGKFGPDSFGGAAPTEGSKPEEGTEPTEGGKPEEGTEPASGGSQTSDQWLKVTGGNISVVSDSDSIDINGSATIEGGNLVLTGPSNSIETVIDYDQGSFVVNGGSIIATSGYSNMFQSIDESGAQTAIQIIYDQVQAKDSQVVVKDSSGNEVINYTPVRDFQALLLCNDELSVGEEYTITTGDADFKVTLSDTVTFVSDSGEAVTINNNMQGGGGGGRGGMNSGEMPDGEAPSGERPQGNPPGKSGSSTGSETSDEDAKDTSNNL